MTGQGSSQIEKFDGSDFGYWKMQVEDYLYKKNLYQPLTGLKREAMSATHWALLDRKALGFVRLIFYEKCGFQCEECHEYNRYYESLGRHL